MKKNVSLVLAAGLACGVVGFAHADETVSFTAVNSMENQGNGANEHRTATLVNSGPIGRIVISGQLTEVNTGTYASEARIRVTPPGGGAAFNVQPFTTGNFTGSITVTNFAYTLGTPVAEGQGAWDLEFFESYNDGAGADSVWDTISLTFVVPPQPPANDECANAIPVTVGNAVSGDNSAATNSVLSACGGGGNGKDVWYSFTAPAAGNYNVATCGSGFDTVLTAYDACGGSELACNDDADCADTLRSKISLTGLADGQTVMIRVAGYAAAGGTPASGTFSMVVTLPPVPPANDDCSAAIAITGDTAFDTALATDSGVTLTNCNLPTTIHNDIWYAYTASGAGTLTLDTCGSTIDTVVALFDACGGNQVACNDDSATGSGSPCEGTTRSYLNYAMTAGQTVYISLGAYAAATSGSGTLHVSFAAAPCPADFNGDNFVDGFDYDDFVACFEGDPCPPGKTADFNGDGFPDGFDYDDFVAAFETGALAEFRKWVRRNKALAGAGLSRGGERCGSITGQNRGCGACWGARRCFLVWPFQP